MPVFSYIEQALGQLFYFSRGYDGKLFTKTGAFSDLPESNIEVTSPNYGQSGSNMSFEHSIPGGSRFPSLKWNCRVSSVKEYLLIVQDPDAPIPIAPVHGIYWAIPAECDQLGPEDIDRLASKTNRGPTPRLKLGRNFRGTVYDGPGPPLGHGAHRYFYQIVALDESLDPARMSEIPTYKELAEVINGKVIGWGHWIGVYEKKASAK